MLLGEYCVILFGEDMNKCLFTPDNEPMVDQVRTVPKTNVMNKWSFSRVTYYLHEQK